MNNTNDSAELYATLARINAALAAQAAERAEWSEDYDRKRARRHARPAGT